MNTSELVEWQRIDPVNGLIEPWLTHPFMDMIKTWDLSNKTILETGGGRSTAWWRSKAKWVDTIESSEEWETQIINDLNTAGLNNGRLFCKELPDGVQDKKQKFFDMIPTDMQYDIVIVDGIWRFEMLQWALDHFKEKGGIIIADNWQQDYVWISPAAEDLMNPYKIHRFEQPNHINHEGKPWNTSYWII